MTFDRNLSVIHDSYSCGKGSRMGSLMSPWPTQREQYLYVGYSLSFVIVIVFVFVWTSF